MSIEPAKRGIAVALNIRPRIRLPPASQALIGFPDAVLGLTPQALCWRPLRGLSEARSRGELQCKPNRLEMQAVMAPRVCQARSADM